MHSANVATDDVALAAATRRVARSIWPRRALRVGLAARGVVFLVLGYLVARIALGALGEPSTREPASLTGVPQAVAGQPGGRAALAILAVGLALYALFSLVDTILHHNDEDPAAKRWGDRALSLWGFVMYSAFSVYAFSVALSATHGQSSAADHRQKAQWSATVLRWPAGWLWLGAAGVVLLGMTAFLVSRAARRTFTPRLERHRMSSRMWLLAQVLGAIGYLGRAMLFGVVGGCILNAAVEDNPQSGQGVDGSLRILAASAGGPLLLGVLSAALVVYGLYLFVETYYRRV